MTDNKALFDRIGGSPSLARIADHFVSSLQKDSTLEHFFKGCDKHKIAQIVDRVAQYLAALAGGPSQYDPATMVSVLSNLGITDRNWDTAIGHLISADQSSGLSKEVYSELVQIISRRKDQVVGIKGQVNKAAN